MLATARAENRPMQLSQAASPRAGARGARRLLLAALALGALALLPAAGAAAKKGKQESNRPEIVSVRPKTAKIGDQVLVIGNRFLKGKGRDTVYFKRESGGRQQVVFVKGDGLDTHTIGVTLPTKLLQIMGTSGGKVLESSFVLRVQAKHLGEEFTSKIKLTVEPPPAGDCDRDGLQDSLERQVGSDICALDTDGDKLTDFFEYSSAKSINGGVYPFPGLFPGKRPIPNPIKADTDGDALPDNREDTDDDHLTAEREQEISTKVAQAPRCGEALVGGLPNPFFNNLQRPKPYYNDGAEDSDRDGTVDGGDIPGTLNLPVGSLPLPRYAGEDLDCDGWVPRWEFVIPAKDKNAGTDLESDEDEPHFLTFADQSLCDAGAPRTTFPGNKTFCQATYKAAAIACSTSPPPPALLGNYVWLDNYAERGDSASVMQSYGDMYDTDADNDGVPDGCDDQDFDGFPNALEIHLARDQRWRNVNFVKGDEPTTEEGKWDPLDACLPGPTMNGLKRAPSGCIGDSPTQPNGPLGPGRPQETAPGGGEGEGTGQGGTGGGTGTGGTGG